MQEGAVSVGLRVDVDTFRGTRRGVPRLLSLLDKHNIKASFFFTLGPDNMGRHLWRLFKPAFMKKMLRSRASSLYGWSILLAGTFWPGRRIGYALSRIIREAHDAGHEVGVHAWDHHKWQAYVETMSPEEINSEIQRAYEVLQNIVSTSPSCSAAAGWKCTEDILLAKEKFPFRYNSDCRGQSIFRPMVRGQICTPQIPVTLPTYDEAIGRNGITDGNYNDILIDRILLQTFNVLTIHAEVEGIVCAEMFDDFLAAALRQRIQFVPLGQLLPDRAEIPVGTIVNGSLPGREGSLCMQNIRQIAR